MLLSNEGLTFIDRINNRVDMLCYFYVNLVDCYLNLLLMLSPRKKG